MVDHYSSGFDLRVPALADLSSGVFRPTPVDILGLDQRIVQKQRKLLIGEEMLLGNDVCKDVLGIAWW